MVLNKHASELKETNPGSNAIILAERQNLEALVVFQRMYVCLIAIKEGFIAGCRRLIGLDGCFLKGLIKGQLMVVVGREGNNQMFLIAWATVKKETTQSWTWFLQHLQSDLSIGDSLGWSVVSIMQKVSNNFHYYSFD